MSMTATLADDQVVCFGVACPHHGRCARYLAVDHATDERRIGTCEQAGEWPRFVWQPVALAFFHPSTISA